MEKIYQIQKDGKANGLPYKNILLAQVGMESMWNYWKQRERERILDMTVSELFERQYFCITFTDHTTEYQIGIIQFIQPQN